MTLKTVVEISIEVQGFFNTLEHLKTEKQRLQDELGIINQQIQDTQNALEVSKVKLKTEIGTI